MQKFAPAWDKVNEYDTVSRKLTVQQPSRRWRLRR